MKKNDVGRPSQLDDKDFFLKIRELILDGNTYEQVQEILDIPKGTWNHWYYNNTHNFQDVLMTYVQERKLNKAEIKIETLIDSEDERVALQASTFIAETLGKRHYSKKTETEGTLKLEVQPISGMKIIQDNDTTIQK